LVYFYKNTKFFVFDESMSTRLDAAKAFVLKFSRSDGIFFIFFKNKINKKNIGYRLAAKLVITRIKV